MVDSNLSARLLLGTVGWSDRAWVRDYYPAGLPPDWRLAYYANDCSCLLLPAGEWREGLRDELAEALEEAPDTLRLFADGAGAGIAAPDPALLPPERTVMLADRRGTPPPGYRQWVADGPGSWADPESGSRLLRWAVDGLDLRALRERVEAMTARPDAIVLDGEAAGPRRVVELRTLLELMGRD